MRAAQATVFTGIIFLFAMALCCTWSPSAVARAADIVPSANTASTVPTVSVTQALKDAEALLAGARFAEAAAAYERMAAAGMAGPDICYNIGTAWLKAGNLGLGVAWLERALTQDPGHKAARHNLDLARARIAPTPGSNPEGPSDAMADSGLTLEGVVAALSLDAWGTLLLAVAWALGLLLLAALFIMKQRRSAGLVAAAALLVCLLLCSGLFRMKTTATIDTVHAVAITSTEAREGPNPGFPSPFKIPEGMKVVAEGRIDEWTMVRLPNGLRGYVLTADLLTL